MKTPAMQRQKLKALSLSPEHEILLPERFECEFLQAKIKKFSHIHGGFRDDF